MLAPTGEGAPQPLQDPEFSSRPARWLSGWGVVLYNQKQVVSSSPGRALT